MRSRVQRQVIPPRPGVPFRTSPPSLRQQIYNFFAADTVFLALLADGINSFRGSDELPEPLGDNADCPWAYIELMDEVATANPYAVGGIIRLWVYDEPNAGYVRIHDALMRAVNLMDDYIALVDQQEEIAYFADTATGECILELATGQLSGPGEDSALGKLQRWASYPYTKAYQGVAA